MGAFNIEIDHLLTLHRVLCNKDYIKGKKSVASQISIRYLWVTLIITMWFSNKDVERKSISVDSFQELNKLGLQKENLSGLL